LSPLLNLPVAGDKLLNEDREVLWVGGVMLVLLEMEYEVVRNLTYHKKD